VSRWLQIYIVETGDVGPAFAQGRQRALRPLGEGVAAEDILGDASETPVYARCSAVTSVLAEARCRGWVCPAGC
jgi:hypothetical protein